MAKFTRRLVRPEGSARAERGRPVVSLRSTPAGFAKSGLMRIRRVYIKRAGGEIASEACYTAWRGFSHLGYPLDFFEWDDLIQKCLRLDRLTLVVGGTIAVHT